MVTVDDTGLMTGIATGTATVTCTVGVTETPFTVTVSPDAPPAQARAMAYVALREFYADKRARLPKYFANGHSYSVCTPGNEGYFTC